MLAELVKDRTDSDKEDQKLEAKSEVLDEQAEMLKARQIMESTPAWRLHRAEIQKAFRENDYIIINGGTGSGKSTALYSILPLEREDRVLMTQPKRNLARRLAGRIAQIAGVKLGDEVNYQYRGSGQRPSAETKFTVVTEGTALSIFTHDHLLSQYSVIVIDEAHNNSVDQVAFTALLLKTQEDREAKGMKPLKIISMTATPDTQKLKEFYPKAVEINVEGKMYNVEPHTLENKISDPQRPQAAAEILMGELMHPKMDRKNKDTLIFVPGVKDIKDTEAAILAKYEAIKAEMIKDSSEKEALSELKSLGLADEDGSFAFEIIHYHSKIPLDTLNKQLDSKTKDKIVIATEAAQEGVNFPWARVISFGRVKETKFDPTTGFESLQLADASISALIQQMGRAGRTEDGDWFVLLTQEELERRSKARIPEVARKNLLSFVLTLKRFGITSLEGLKMMDVPPVEHLAYALRTLQKWGVLNEKEELTPFGSMLAEFGIEPRYGYLVANGITNGCSDEACTIAAYLSASHATPLFISKDQEEKASQSSFVVDNSSDFHTILNFWKEYKENKKNPKWNGYREINRATLRSMEEIRSNLVSTLREQEIDLISGNLRSVDMTVAKTFIDRLLIRQPDGKYDSLDGHLRNREITDESALRQTNPEILIMGDESSDRYISEVQVITIGEIEEIAPEYVKKTIRSPRYDSQKDAVVREVELTLAGQTEYKTLAPETLPVSMEEALDVFASALAVNSIPLAILKENQETLRRINYAWRMAGGIADHFTISQLGEFYKKRLQNLRGFNRRELEEAIARGEVDLTLNVKEYLPPSPIVQPEVSEEEPILLQPVKSDAESDAKPTLMERLISVKDRFLNFFRNLFGRENK